jgi:hypothetical protein
MATVATAAAAGHNAALLVPKVGFFGFLQLRNPRIRVSFCSLERGGREVGEEILQKMNFLICILVEFVL